MIDWNATTIALIAAALFLPLGIVTAAYSAVTADRRKRAKEAIERQRRVMEMIREERGRKR